MLEPIANTQKKTLLKILLIGCGNMGKMFIENFHNNNLISANSVICDKHLSIDDFNKFYKIKQLNKIESCFSADIVILAIRPQSFRNLTTTDIEILKRQNYFVSVMAGVSIAELQSKLSNPNVIRLMPNTPAKIGKGLTAFYAKKNIKKEFFNQTQILFGNFGKIINLEEEDHINIVTSLSGSGPAYIFLIAEILADIAKKNGLEKFAKDISFATITGAAALMEYEKDTPFFEQRKKLTAKAGTTEAALCEFITNYQPLNNISNLKQVEIKGKLYDVIERGVLAAYRRSKELKENKNI